jgi:hypothetical protein
MAQEPVDHSNELDGSPAAIRRSMTRTRRDLARHLAALRDRLLNPGPIMTATKEPTMPAQKKREQTSPSKKKNAPDEANERRADPRTSTSEGKASNGSSKKAGATASSARSSKKAAASKSSSANGSSKRKVSDSKKSKSSSSRGRQSAEKSLVEKTGEVLDTMVAGAVVGAVTGAARHVAHEPGALPLVDPESLTGSDTPDQEKPTTREVLGELASGAALGAMTGAAKSILPAESAPETKKRSKKR